VGAETDTVTSIENFYDFTGTNFDDTIVGSASADYRTNGRSSSRSLCYSPKYERRNQKFD
jgi:hypothetical protein